MEELNQLLNTALGTPNENYCDGSENIQKCYSKFYPSTENDDTALNVSLYFFPFSGYEKNTKEFWFIKYKNNSNYNEFDFALDILRVYIQYLSDKNAKNFDSRIIQKVQKFGAYKSISDYLSVIKDYMDILLAIDAYLTRDSYYFEKFFNLNVSAEKLQTSEFIELLKKQITSKKEYFLISRKYNNLLNLFEQNQYETKVLFQKINNQIKELKDQNFNQTKNIKELKDQNFNQTKNIKELKDQNFNLTKKIKELNEQNLDQAKNIKELNDKVNDLTIRLDKIDLRDTIKMSFKYLYNILYSNFNFPYENNFWAQIQKIKEILSKDKFSKFKFIINFIKDIQYTKLENLNKAAHNPNEKIRKIYDIKKYMQINSDKVDLQLVVDFFQKLPNLDDFINLNLLYYFNQELAEQKFKTKVDYSKLYSKIFSD